MSTKNVALEAPEAPPAKRVKLDALAADVEAVHDGNGEAGPHVQAEPVYSAHDGEKEVAADAAMSDAVEPADGAAADGTVDAGTDGDDGGGHGGDGDGDGDDGDGDDGDGADAAGAEGNGVHAEGDAAGASGDAAQTNGTAPEPDLHLGYKTFKFSQDARNYFADLIRTSTLNQPLNEYELCAVLDLVRKGHPRAEEKVGVGVRAVCVTEFLVDKGKATRCFLIKRVDGSTEDVSYLKCLNTLFPGASFRQGGSYDGRSYGSGDGGGRGGFRGRGGRGGRGGFGGRRGSFGRRGRGGNGRGRAGRG